MWKQTRKKLESTYRYLKTSNAASFGSDIKGLPTWQKGALLGASAGAMVGIGIYAGTLINDDYTAPRNVRKSWAEIRKLNESKQTAFMRRQYTDFGSPWRGIIQKAARLNIGLPSKMGEFKERTVFDKVKQFFNVGSVGSTPYKKINKVKPIHPREPGRTRPLVEKLPERPLQGAVGAVIPPGEYTTISELALGRAPIKFGDLRAYAKTVQMTSKLMQGGQGVPLFHGLEVVSKAGQTGRVDQLMKKVQGGVIGNQLSQSSNPLGSVGVITRSDIHMAFSKDVWTAPFGKYRYAQKGVYDKERIHSLAGYKPPTFIGNDITSGGAGARIPQTRYRTKLEEAASGKSGKIPNYDEIVATPKAITGVWSKSDPESIKAGKELAKRLGVPAHVVEDKTTIQKMFPKEWNKVTRPEVTPRETLRQPMTTTDSSAHVVINAHETKIGHTKYGNAKTPSHLFKDLI